MSDWLTVRRLLHDKIEVEAGDLSDRELLAKANLQLSGKKERLVLESRKDGLAVLRSEEAES